MSTRRRIPINQHDPRKKGAPEGAHPGAGADAAEEAAASTQEGKGSTRAGEASTPIDAGAGPAAAGTRGPAGEAPGQRDEPAPRPGPEQAPGQAPGKARGKAATLAPEQASELAAERDRLADALLRLRAEFENYRRRSARELIESRQRAQGELLNDLLPVLDNLERALDAAEHHEEGKVLTGVRLVRDLFVDQLKRAGVEEIETVGAPFDPAFHEAMLMQPAEYDEGVVSAVLQKGYRQGERVLRPARVAVSSGPGDTTEGETGR